MNITVLAASGATGLELTRQALDRGHVVTAIARDLDRVTVPHSLARAVPAGTAVLAAGGTVFHPGPLTDGPLSADRRAFGLADVPHRLFPARVSRATVAAAMLDEAENRAHVGDTVIPVER